MLDSDWSVDLWTLVIFRAAFITYQSMRAAVPSDTENGYVETLEFQTLENLVLTEEELFFSSRAVQVPSTQQDLKCCR